MRLFLAIGLPGEVRDRLADIQREFACYGMLKLVEHGNLHLTLKFLGEVHESKADAVEEALDSVKHGRFRVSLRGVGAFPNPGRVRVVWAGVADGCGEVVGLQCKVDAALKPLGFKPDRRFHPHVTLGRAKGEVDKTGLRDFLKQNADVDYGAFDVGGYLLMQSRLTPKGPVYSVTREYLLD
jgi:2'-5' RNA ligase